MICPYCQSKKVSCASSLFLNLFRTLWNSNKRYCAGCKKRWQSRSPCDFLPRLFSFGVLAVFFLVLLLVIRLEARHGGFTGSFFSPPSSGPGGNEKLGPDFKGTTQDINKKRKEALDIMVHAQMIERQQKQHSVRL